MHARAPWCQCLAVASSPRLIVIYAKSNFRYTAQNQIYNGCKIDYVVIAGQPTVQELQSFTDDYLPFIFRIVFSSALTFFWRAFLRCSS
jgi:hypothetical protein